jgi:hypothetical protein
MTGPRHVPETGPEHALDRARGAALAALRAAGPTRPWQGQARALIAVVAALTLVGAAAVAAGGTSWAVLAPRLPTLSLLLAAQVVALWSAISPAGASRRSWLAPLAWLLVAAGTTAVLAGRHTAAPDASFGWICSLSHVSFGLAPLAAVVWSLRDMADSGRRGFTAGLGVATAGLFWGELACQRNLLHVLVHHLGAALALVAACLLASRLIRRRSFAP